MTTKFVDMQGNPLKGKPKITEDELPDDILHQAQEEICKFVVQNASDAQSLHNFAVAKENSQCAFAKRAKLWGSKDWEYDKSIGS